MKLKTLKNIAYHHGEKVEVKKLKAEAIKWVKFLAESTLVENNDKVNWIMEFFNITEEDLK